MQQVSVSTPSRLCLFGEHLDYLNLEVVALAINLRFKAKAKFNNEKYINIKIRSEENGVLNNSSNNKYDKYIIPLDEPIEYENKRDYIRSTINVLLRKDYKIKGMNIVMDSDIPIQKGMCSSSTMILVLIKVILELIEHKDAKNNSLLAYLAYSAEVLEFKEPGGMMDHYTSALGGLVHLDFFDGKANPKKISRSIPGCFILVDSLRKKNTTLVLANAKKPVVSALNKLDINSVRDIKSIKEAEDLSIELNETERKCFLAAVDNYRILKEGINCLNENKIDMKRLGALIYKHHRNLADKLKISTPEIEEIIKVAKENGALGGKINGSGGGGCCFVYAKISDASKIIESIEKLGYPTKLLKGDDGVKKEENNG